MVGFPSGTRFPAGWRAQTHIRSWPLASKPRPVGVGGGECSPGCWGSSPAHAGPKTSHAARLCLKVLICEMGTAKSNASGSRSHEGKSQILSLHRVALSLGTSWRDPCPASSTESSWCSGFKSCPYCRVTWSKGSFFSPQSQGVGYGLSMVTEPWLAHSRCSGSPWSLSGAL